MIFGRSLENWKVQLQLDITIHSCCCCNHFLPIAGIFVQRMWIKQMVSRLQIDAKSFWMFRLAIHIKTIKLVGCVVLPAWASPVHRENGLGFFWFEMDRLRWDRTSNGIGTIDCPKKPEGLGNGLGTLCSVSMPQRLDCDLWLKVSHLGEEDLWSKSSCQADAVSKMVPNPRRKPSSHHLHSISSILKVARLWVA